MQTSHLRHWHDSTKGSVCLWLLPYHMRAPACTFAEALACGIPCRRNGDFLHLSFDESHDYARFVPERDPASIAEAPTEIFRDRQLR
jgi:hypothetical protein